jgi:hypothetical protein
MEPASQAKAAGARNDDGFGKKIQLVTETATTTARMHAQMFERMYV